MPELPISQEWLCDAVYWNDASGSIVDVNQAACDALAMSKDELLNMKVWEMDVSFHPDTWGQSWNNALKEKRMQIRTKHYGRSKESYWVDMVVQACQIDGKDLICSIAKNIESEVQLGKEVKALKKRL